MVGLLPLEPVGCRDRGGPNHGDADCDAGVCCAVTGKKLAGAKESVAAG